MKRSSMASKPCSLVCPLCEAGRLHTLGHDKARCDSCLDPLSGAMLEALSEIAILQNAVGSHACECGHPEMRLLPDGVFHCPACGCEGTSARGLKGQEREGSSGRKVSEAGGWYRTDPLAPEIRKRSLRGATAGAISLW